MKILVVGGGGREHAMVKKLRENSRVDKIFVTPGNGGIANDAVCVDISATDIDKISEWAAENKISFAVVAADNPLCMGLVDLLNEKGINCFGPTKDAAIIEGSKVFSKNLMKKYGIPTAEFEVFTDLDDALAYLNSASFPLVIKSDGLAYGKGVYIVENLEDARDALNSIMKEKIFGESGDKVVIEEFLEGPEVTVLSFTDGHCVRPMLSSMDHKRIFDGDKGPNTGGMGVIAPNPHYTKEIAEQCMREIFIPTIEAMNAEGRTFKGCLYFGLMLSSKGPKVIEYNCRFGDPETQALLPLLKTDLFEIMLAVSEERLGELDIEWSDKSSCCVMLVSKGYPGSFEKDKEITGLDSEALYAEDIFVYHSGTKQTDGKLLTSGGRVLGVVALADNLKNAQKRTYEACSHISFDGMQFRRDIGAKAFENIGG
ncbi:MAG: phosphoribosylamine--glycine ligase [Clostridiales bacterium]|nr:phosphoribosylamine--glycine ligase [Clostridiales bacterium]